MVGEDGVEMAVAAVDHVIAPAMNNCESAGAISCVSSVIYPYLKLPPTTIAQAHRPDKPNLRMEYVCTSS